MSATIASTVFPAADRHRSHRWILIFLSLLAIAALIGLAAYGLDYYTLDAAHRPLSPKHAALKPGGVIGLKLGIFGLLMFFAIFLYPVRKRWAWLSRQGSSKHWLDFHVLMGLTAPFTIAFHSSFKFHGFAGVAFWIMTAVAISGVIGRYLYGQIPRSLSSAELSMAELEQQRSALSQRLAGQRLLPAADVSCLLRLPSPVLIARMPLAIALVYMIVLDLYRPLRIARLRRHTISFSEKLTTFGGLRRTRHLELEYAIHTAREQASLSKRILFLSRAQRVFHLWHVIHRPFSYSFAVLAVIHITVVTMMGYVWW